MEQLRPEHYLQSEIIMIDTMLNHVLDNLSDTVFSQHDEIETLLETLRDGVEVVSLRMKLCMKETHERRCRGC